VSEGFLVAASNRAGFNLVIFPKSLRSSSIFEIEEQEEFPAQAT
jgi:hypothetical protein